MTLKPQKKNKIIWPLYRHNSIDFRQFFIDPNNYNDYNSSYIHPIRFKWGTNR